MSAARTDYGVKQMNLIDTKVSSRPTAPVASKGRIPPDGILYSIGTCALGDVLVARSPAGVCAILIGSEAAELKDDLATRFPASVLIPDGAELREDLAKVVRFIESPSEGLDLPLDMHGTPFQRRVWEALCAIPTGTTVTYTELARSIGEPRSARAVARACATSAIALAIPCHRVLRSDGALSGYRWGIERKRELLNREAMA